MNAPSRLALHLPSVLSVYCAIPNPGGAGTLAIASGVVLDRDGLVVTTSEVAAHAGELFVGLADGTQRSARRLGADAGAGLALLKVDGPSLEPIEMGGRDTVMGGDAALAMGDALGLGTTATQGIVSAVRSARLEGTAAADFIQTDARIHPGNFGGALLDDAGRLVGITVGKVGTDEGEGLAFAVPAERVEQVIARLRLAAHVPEARPAATPGRGRFTEIATRRACPQLR